MANRHRGEVTCEVNGQKLVFRPDFRFVAECEDITGRNFFDFVAGLNKDRPTVTIVAKICAEAAQSGGTPVEVEAMGAHILDYGLFDFLHGPFAELLARAGGYYEPAPEQEKKATE